MGQTLISLSFIACLAFLIFLYYGLVPKYQWLLLLIASYIFYGITNRLEYLLLLAVISGANFLTARIIHDASSRSKGKLFLRLIIFFNLCILVVFKYARFIGNSLFGLDSGSTPVWASLAVPLGLSFIIFKAIAYVIDTYRRKGLYEHNIGKFFLFMSYFPEISAGPIDRAESFLPQISGGKKFVEGDVVSGLRLILWGYFKKIVIANNLALYVNQVYGKPRDYSGIILVIATYFLSFQIYADFSGYTDIVRGISRLLGYKIPSNFDTPYLAKSISDFWTRWHITLSTWLRDYLFLPISFYLSKKIRPARLLRLDSNILIYCSSALITFILGGIWHGSAWTYVVWGFLHGFYLSASNSTRRLRKRIRIRVPIHHRYPRLVSVLKILFCFHIVTFSWIFFRAQSIKDAVYIIRNLLPLKLTGFYRLFVDPLGMLNLGTSKYGLIIAGLGAFCLVAMDIGQQGHELPRFLSTRNVALRWAVYYAMLFSILLFGEYGLRQFIYAQF